MENKLTMNILVATLIFLFFFAYMFRITLIVFIINTFLKQIIYPLIDKLNKSLSQPGNNILLDIKTSLKILVYLTIFNEIIVHYLFSQINKQHTSDGIRGSNIMAIRGIDSRRLHHMVFSAERVIKDADGNIVRNEDGTPKLMSHEEAYSMAESEEFTVIDIRPRTVRQYAEERDRMIEVHSKGGALVQHIATGTMDMSSLLSCVVGWQRFLPPVGMCERCGVEHKGQYLDYNALINSPANSGTAGIYRNEICIDHMSEDQRAEVLAFIRNMGEEQVGEG